MFSQVREEQMVRICLYVHVCVAPTMIVGVWSMEQLVVSRGCESEGEGLGGTLG